MVLLYSALPAAQYVFHFCIDIWRSINFLKTNLYKGQLVLFKFQSLQIFRICCSLFSASFSSRPILRSKSVYYRPVRDTRLRNIMYWKTNA